MPRLTQANPLYRRHRASGQAVVTIHGHDHYLGPWNTKASKAEYDRLIGEWLASGRQNAAAGSDLTISEVVEQFWQHVQTYYRDAAGNSDQRSKQFQNDPFLIAPSLRSNIGQRLLTTGIRRPAVQDG